MLPNNKETRAALCIPMANTAAVGRALLWQGNGRASVVRHAESHCRGYHACARQSRRSRFHTQHPRPPTYYGWIVPYDGRTEPAATGVCDALFSEFFQDCASTWLVSQVVTLTSPDGHTQTGANWVCPNASACVLYG